MNIKTYILSIFSILLLFTLSLNSCTITKRVHNKGWHISWNKNYRSDNSNVKTTIESGETNALEGKEDDKQHAYSLTKTSEQTNTEIEAIVADSGLKGNESDGLDAAASTVNRKETIAPADQLPDAELKESGNVQEIPLGGPFIFLGLFTALSVGLLAAGAAQFAIGAFLVAIAALVIIAHVKGIQNGKSNAHIRPSGFYNSILFMILCSVILAYLIIYGGLAEIYGVIIAIFLLFLIGMLIFLIYQTKDLRYSEVQKRKQQKEAEKKQQAESASPEEKKKNKLAALIVCGIAAALFLTIALLNY